MNTFVNVPVYPINKTIRVPSSKSHSNRLLILSAIHPSTIVIENYSHSSDVLSLINCLQKIGLNIEITPTTIRVSDQFPQVEEKQSNKNATNATNAIIELDAGDGGTTNRFLLPLLARGCLRYKIKASNQMLKRPMSELFNILKTFAVDLSSPSLSSSSSIYPIEIQGPIKLNSNLKIEVDCSQSTQFLSALMLGLADLPIEFKAKNLSTSIPYLNLTKKLIDNFFHSCAQGNNHYNHFVVPADFSSIAYPAALALICGESVTIENCTSTDFFDSLQADAELFNIIDKMSGAKQKHYTFDSSGMLKIFKQRNELIGQEIDCSSFPDLVPTLAFICSYSKGESKLKNIGNLKFKESNRIVEIGRVLNLFNIKHIYNELKDELIIDGHGVQPKRPSLDFISPADHRIAMMSYLFMRKNSGGRIYNCNCVNKSFPDFFTQMEI
ncbi:MAG: hypothetical protein HQK49_19845 [Oligoflexia bacterium]|nr:hypothetical protein [Oligoflexia bacterium]